MANKKDLFKKELKDLFEEYNAFIGFDCSECSDLHGVYAPKMVAWLDNEKIVLSHDYDVDKNDLK